MILNVLQVSEKQIVNIGDYIITETIVDVLQVSRKRIGDIGDYFVIQTIVDGLQVSEEQTRDIGGYFIIETIVNGLQVSEEFTASTENRLGPLSLAVFLKHAGGEKLLLYLYIYSYMQLFCYVWHGIESCTNTIILNNWII